MFAGIKSYYSDTRTAEYTVIFVFGLSWSAFVQTFGAELIYPIVEGTLPEGAVAEIYVGSETINLIALIEQFLVLLLTFVVIYPLLIRPVLRRRNSGSSEKAKTSKESEEEKTEELLTEIRSTLERRQARRIMASSGTNKSEPFQD